MQAHPSPDLTQANIEVVRGWQYEPEVKTGNLALHLTF